MKPAHLGEWILLVTLALWWLLSLLLQRKSRLAPFVERFDIFGLLPRYRFYAPRPSALDYFLEVRTRDAELHESAWSRLAFDPPSLKTTFWHPSMEAENVFNTLAFLLVRRAEQRGEASAGNGAAARCLLHWAQAQPASARAAGVQFQILATEPLHCPDGPTVRFRSEWRPLPK